MTSEKSKHDKLREKYNQRKRIDNLRPNPNNLDMFNLFLLFLFLFVIG